MWGYNALVLLVVAGLVLRTLAAVGNMDPGFDFRHLVGSHLSTSSTDLNPGEREQWFHDVADQIALEPLLAFDPEALYQTVVKHDISMCGFIPATAMLAYSRALDAGSPDLVGYATSGDAFGDRSRVVGYAGVVVSA